MTDKYEQDYLEIKYYMGEQLITEKFIHGQFSYTSENIKNKFQTQSGHSDITVIRKDKLTLNISFTGFQEDVERCFDLSQEDTVTLSYISPTKCIREERICEVYGFTYSRVKKSEELDTLQRHIGLYDISFTLEEI